MKTSYKDLNSTIRDISITERLVFLGRSGNWHKEMPPLLLDGEAVEIFFIDYQYLMKGWLKLIRTKYPNSILREDYIFYPEIKNDHTNNGQVLDKNLYGTDWVVLK